MKYLIILLLLAGCGVTSAEEPYILNAKAAPSQGGTVIVTNHNGTATAEAVPTEGWMFFEWRGDSTSREKQITIVMDSDKELTALFIPVYGL